jgi:hypothetical protein
MKLIDKKFDGKIIIKKFAYKIICLIDVLQSIKFLNSLLPFTFFIIISAKIIPMTHVRILGLAKFFFDKNNEMEIELQLT